MKNRRRKDPKPGELILSADGEEVARVDLGPEPDFPPAGRQWSTGDECDRTGLAGFVHCIRGADDPERLSRKEQRARGAGFEAWRKDMAGDPSEWAARIVELLGDGTPRTFNRIVLDLTGRLYTADVALGKAPDHGLWMAVADRRLKHTLKAPILFAVNDEVPDP